MNRELKDIIVDELGIKLRDFSDRTRFNLEKHIIFIRFSNEKTTHKFVMKELGISYREYEIYIFYGNMKHNYRTGEDTKEYTSSHVDRYGDLSEYSCVYGENTGYACTKTELNEKRRYCSDYLVIAQSKYFLRKYKEDNDILKRFTKKEIDEYYDKHRYDKSGYCKWSFQSALDDRLDGYKRNKRQKELDNFDKSNYISYVCQSREMLLNMIKNKALDFKSEDDMSKFANALNGVRWEMSSLFDWEKSNYHSVQAFMNEFKWAKEHIDNAFKLINEM